MNNTDNILYPAYQKLYSAVSALERFRVDDDFFQNISSLDCFFSEYRNVTFVLQKAISHTEYSSWYEENKLEYLGDCKSLVDWRNVTTKEHPFELVKEIEITVYTPSEKRIVTVETFSVENDVKLDTVIDDIKGFLKDIHPNEVFFSVKFDFYDKNSDYDVYDEIMRGIRKMLMLLNDLSKVIGTEDEFSDKLRENIEKSLKHISSIEIIFNQDYVYYPHSNTFDRAQLMKIYPSNVMAQPSKGSVKNLLERMHVKDPFLAFIFMHVLIGTTDLMPTFMIIYDDDSFELDSYHSTLKTTTYRKINEVAEKVKTGNIKTIFFMMTYAAIRMCDISNDMVSVERAKQSYGEILAFAMIDNNLNMLECSFDEEDISNPGSLIDVIKNKTKLTLDNTSINLRPIVKAFVDCREII